MRHPSDDVIVNEVMKTTKPYSYIPHEFQYLNSTYLTDTHMHKLWTPLRNQAHVCFNIHKNVQVLQCP